MHRAGLGKLGLEASLGALTVHGACLWILQH
jgi:hypothetical protein